MTDIILTVDVEDHFHGVSDISRRPPYDTIFARDGGESYGIERIVRSCKTYSAGATFFIDVYDHGTVKEGVVQKACEWIHGEGFEVGLHTHPDLDLMCKIRGNRQKRGMLKSFPLNDQIAFIEKGKERIFRWIGKLPTSHRAGGWYGANYDTLLAVEQCKIPIDSSMFYRYPTCDLNEPLLTRNAPRLVRTLFELPVTVTQTVYQGRWGHLHFPLATFYKKIGLDWCTLSEMKLQMSALQEAKVNPILLFMHSYSLLDLQNGFKPHLGHIRTFDLLLEWIQQQKTLRWNTAEGFYKRYRQSGDTLGSDNVPRVALAVGDLPPDQWKRATQRFLRRPVEMVRWLIP